jgi:hypothetical protein
MHIILFKGIIRDINDYQNELVLALQTRRILTGEFIREYSPLQQEINPKLVDLAFCVSLLSLCILGLFSIPLLFSIK